MSSTIASRVGLYEKEYVGAGYGVEVELEGAEETLMRYPPDGWSCTSDNSLRNGGIEYVMDGPCTYKVAVDGLAKLYELKGRRGLVTSQRTGMHVHIDVRNMTTKDVANLYTAYVACEPWLMALAGENRWHNLFCVPSHANVSQAVGVVRMTRATASLGSSCRSMFNKYSSFNLLPIPRQGSVEIRMAPAYDSLSDAVRWLQAIDHIVDVSANTDARTVAAEYLDDGFECVRRRFPLIGDMADPVPWAVPLEDASMVTLLSIAPKNTPRTAVAW